MSILDTSEARLREVWGRLSEVRARLSRVRAHISRVWARLSGVWARPRGVWARQSGVQVQRKQSSDTSKWSPGKPKQSPGTPKRSLEKLKMLITSLFLSFERPEKNLCYNHIFCIQICKSAGPRLSGTGPGLNGTLAILQTLLNSKRLNIYLKLVNIISLL